MVKITEGIDVSKWQKDIDWKTVANSGKIDFACAKCTQGHGYVDPKFIKNWKGIADAGLIRGAYHFASTTNDPIKEANNFINYLDGLAMEDFLALDVETEGLRGQKFADWIFTWMDEVGNKTGKIPFLYTYGSFFRNSLGKVSDETINKLKKYPLWLAAYVVDPNKHVPAVWKDMGWTLWQKTGDVAPPGSKPLYLPGIPSVVDYNIYNGPVEDFKQLILNLYVGKNNATTNAINIISGD